jgi:hypothetical protein
LGLRVDDFRQGLPKVRLGLAALEVGGQRVGLRPREFDVQFAGGDVGLPAGVERIEVFRSASRTLKRIG